MTLVTSTDTVTVSHNLATDGMIFQCTQVYEAQSVVEKILAVMFQAYNFVLFRILQNQC